MEINNFIEGKYSNEQMYRSLDWLMARLEKLEFNNEIDDTYKEVAMQTLKTILTKIK